MCVRVVGGGSEILKAPGPMKEGNALLLLCSTMAPWQEGQGPSGQLHQQNPPARYTLPAAGSVMGKRTTTLEAISLPQKKT